jgi:hypothetical protein
MSLEEISFGDALENMAATQEPTAQQTENTQPIKTDVDELIEYFCQFATEKDAKQAMKQNVNNKRFFMPNTGKDYSTANCYKAISRCRENDLFKGEKPTNAEAKDLTYKMDAPPIPPRPQEPVSISDYVADDEPQFTELPYEPPPEPSFQKPQPTQQRTFAEPSARIVKSYTFIAKTICNKLSQAVKDSEMKAVFSMDEKEAQEVGYAIAVLTVDENGIIDPRTAAVGVLVTAIIGRILPYVPKLLEKINKKGAPKQ